MSFKVGDMAVHPAHGVCQIREIQSVMIEGARQDFYVLQILSGTNVRASLMVPTANSASVGMRGLISDQEITDIFQILSSPKRVAQTAWKRRFKEFTDRLNRGSLRDIAEVLRDLYTLKSGKDLSFSEKRMLDRAKSMIVTEISVARREAEDVVEQEVDRMLLN